MERRGRRRGSSRRDPQVRRVPPTEVLPPCGSGRRQAAIDQPQRSEERRGQPLRLHQREAERVASERRRGHRLVVPHSVVETDPAEFADGIVIDIDSVIQQFACLSSCCFRNFNFSFEFIDVATWQSVADVGSCTATDFHSVAHDTRLDCQLEQHLDQSISFLVFDLDPSCFILLYFFFSFFVFFVCLVSSER